MKPHETDPLHTPPFTVPEHYWDTLTDRILRRVEKTRRPPRRRIPAPLRPYIGIAALFLIVMGVMRLLIPAASPAHDTPLLSGHTLTEEPLPEEELFDREFNPTREEIIEYLTEVAAPYELLIASSAPY